MKMMMPYVLMYATLINNKVNGFHHAKVKTAHSIIGNY